MHIWASHHSSKVSEAANKGQKWNWTDWSKKEFAEDSLKDRKYFQSGPNLKQMNEVFILNFSTSSEKVEDSGFARILQVGTMCNIYMYTLTLLQ